MKHIVLVLAVAGLLTAGCSTATDDTDQRAGLAEKICKQEVAERLKNPDSAQWRNVETEVVSETDAWKFTGEVSGENSFGGRNGYVTWACVATYDYDTKGVHADTVRVDSDQ